MVGDPSGPGRGRIVVLAAGVAACGSGTPPGATPCPPGSATGTVTVAQVLASTAELVACPTNPVDPTDDCYGGTAWSVGPNLFLTAGHVVHSGGLGPRSASVSRPYIQVTQGKPVFSGSRILPNAKVVAYDVSNSDIALIQTTDLSLPALPSPPRTWSPGSPVRTCAIRTPSTTTSQHRLPISSPAQQVRSDRARSARTADRQRFSHSRLRRAHQEPSRVAPALLSLSLARWRERCSPATAMASRAERVPKCSQRQHSGRHSISLHPAGHAAGASPLRSLVLCSRSRQAICLPDLGNSTMRPVRGRRLASPSGQLAATASSLARPTAGGVGRRAMSAMPHR